MAKIYTLPSTFHNIPYLERVVAARLNSHMNTYHLHETVQSAYKPGHSTETALLRVQNDILTNMDNQSVTILVLLDLSAAFDTIDHQVLLDRMENMVGVKGVALDWFSSYLSDRTQSVAINHVLSLVAILLLFGVPQGSVLGPLLFLIYMLPLGTIIRSYGFLLHIFADDTQIYLSIKPDNVLVSTSRLEDCLRDIHQWMSFNFLKLNSDKTEVLMIGTYQQLAKFNISALNVAGVSVSLHQHPVRNLGVIFDENMTMEAHVSSVSRSAAFHTRNISRVRKYLTTKSTKTLVNSLVTSRIDYCNSLLSGVSGYLIKRLEQAQNCAARTILRMPKAVSPPLQELHWLPVKWRIDFKIAVMAYNSIMDTAPYYLTELLRPYVPSKSLRSGNACLLMVPRTTNGLGDRSFRVYGPKVWNKLPGHVRAAKDVVTFKKLLKTHYFKIAFNVKRH